MSMNMGIAVACYCFVWGVIAGFFINKVLMEMDHPAWMVSFVMISASFIWPIWTLVTIYWIGTGGYSKYKKEAERRSDEEAKAFMVFYEALMAEKNATVRNEEESRELH